MYNEVTKECICNKCGHTWRARGSKAPIVCSSCTSRAWQDGSRKFDYIIARFYGRDEDGKGKATLCIIPYVDKPSVETEDIFYIKPEDADKYLRGRITGSSALVFVGSFEIGEDQILQVNEMKLIYCHTTGFREYITDAACIYNIKSYYEALRAQKAREEEAQKLAALEEQRKQERLQAALKRIEEEEAHRLEIENARRILADETAGTEDRLNAARLLESVR